MDHDEGHQDIWVQLEMYRGASCPGSALRSAGSTMSDTLAHIAPNILKNTQVSVIKSNHNIYCTIRDLKWRRWWISMIKQHFWLSALTTQPVLLFWNKSSPPGVISSHCRFSSRTLSPDRQQTATLWAKGWLQPRPNKKQDKALLFDWIDFADKKQSAFRLHGQKQPKSLTKKRTWRRRNTWATYYGFMQENKSTWWVGLHESEKQQGKHVV